MPRRRLDLARLALLLGIGWMLSGLAHAGELADAIDAADVSRVRALVAEGRPLEERGSDGKSALMVAARAGDERLVGQIIEAGGDVELATQNGGTALMFAAYSGNVLSVRALIGAGARVDRAGGFDWTPLSVAAVKGKAGVVSELLAHGADPNHRDVYAWTPLMRAIDNGHLEAARLLLAHTGIDVGAVDELGWSALHHAARHGYAELAAGLLDKGADPGIGNADRNTAADIARIGGHTALTRLLEGAAASN